MSTDTEHAVVGSVRELACGVVICAERYVDRVGADAFDRAAWEAQGARRHTSTGRSPVLILERNDETWVLRHYRRGGAVARFIDDHYLYTGLQRTRSYKEWQLLGRMTSWGLPAPVPIAACVQRRGCIYRADIITRYLPDTHALSSALKTDGVSVDLWRRIGRMLHDFHGRGVDHPDLTAHNILTDPRGRVFLVDFDNAVLRAPGRWTRRGIARFERSLRKVALETGTEFDASGWQVLLESYEQPMEAAND